MISAESAWCFIGTEDRIQAHLALPHMKMSFYELPISEAQPPHKQIFLAIKHSAINWLKWRSLRHLAKAFTRNEKNLTTGIGRKTV